MEVFTSRYANKGLVTWAGVKVGITVGTPRWKLPYSVVRLPLLAPPKHILYGGLDEAAFRAAYRETLDAIGLETISAALRQVSGGSPIVLLCFENLDEPDQWCHRRMFAEWWQERTGQIIEELPATSVVEDQPRQVAEQLAFQW